MATRRRFTQEYKDQAVALVVDSGRTIAEVSRSLGIHEMTLGKWVKQAKESGKPATRSDLSGLNGPSWNGSAKKSWCFGWSATSQKKWRPGSRRNSRKVCGARGLGR